MMFETTSSRSSLDSILDDYALPKLDPATSSDVEAQLNEKSTALRLSNHHQSLASLQLSVHRWTLVASALFNIMLIVAFVSIVGGSYLASRTHCASLLAPAWSNSHVLEIEQRSSLL